MFLWQMKFPNTQTPWSILTLSRKKTNIPSCLLSKIKEEVISKYQLSPIMRNRLKYLFHNYQIDWLLYLKYILASLILFLEIFSLFPVWTENWYLKKGNFYQFNFYGYTHKYNFHYLSIPVTKKICLFIVWTMQYSPFPKE